MNFKKTTINNRDEQISYVRKEFFNQTQKELKVAGVSLALNFLFKLYLNLDKIVAKSNKYPLEEINIYNYEKDSVITLRVNRNEFQSKLNQFYREYVMSNILTKFDWYNKVSIMLKEMFSKTFNFDSDHPFVIDMFISCLMLYSAGQNEFNYEKIYSHLVKLLIRLNLCPKESENISKQILLTIEKNNLIFVKKNFLGFLDSFSLSDNFIDSYFFIDSLHLPNVFNFNNYDKSCNTFSKLNKLKETINSFNKDIISLESFKNFCYNFGNEIVIEYTLDYNIIEFDENKFQISEAEKDTVISMLYNFKLLLNEYVFQVIVMSCFDCYYEQPMPYKNVLLRNHIQFI